MKSLRFLYVTFLAAVVLLVETVLFHVVSYLFDYFSAVAMVSWAVLGVGLGALAAGRLNIDEEKLYLFCSIGATAAIYGTVLLLVRYPVLPLIACGVALCFFFPVAYIATIFRDQLVGRVYLFDMAGAGLGVVITVVLFEFFRSEEIMLVVLTVIPLVAALRFALNRRASIGIRIPIVLFCALAAVVSGGLLRYQLNTDELNIIKIFNKEGPYKKKLLFLLKDYDTLVRTYDNLVGRVDVLSADIPGYFSVFYNGQGNDHFTDRQAKEYDYFKKRKTKCPSTDARVPYGLVSDPRIFVVGSSAKGITGTVKKITPLDRITATEINPAIVEIMNKDFYAQSGYVYCGLKPIVGNAISVLKASPHLFDIITLINTHSGRSIGYPSGPDYLHTLETYELYLEHLSKDGFVLYEERPWNRNGTLGTYRMINTMWHALKAGGAKDPSQHFFLWEWAAVKDRNPNYRISMRKHKDGTYVFSSWYYFGMIATREPLVGERLESLLEWYHECSTITRATYLKGVVEVGEYADVFKWIEDGDFSALGSEGFDSSVVTNDRPFPALSTIVNPELEEMFISCAVVFGILMLLCLGSAMPRVDSAAGWILCGYNILIGIGYFFIEILLLQVFQNIFVSPSMTLILVLGLLLISSGIGGLLAGRVPPWVAVISLVPVALAAIYVPAAVIAAGLPAILCKAIAVLLVCLCGFLMGPFFPHGLAHARKVGLADRIPQMFAINSVAGSIAVVSALYMGIRIGYSKTLILALVAYALAALVVLRGERVAAK